MSQPHWQLSLPAHDVLDRINVLLAIVANEPCVSNLSSKARTALDEAKAVVSGLDAYVQRVSTPAPTIVNDMLKKTDETDWASLHEQKVISFPLIKEMAAGGYEAMLLRDFATMIKAKRILEIGVFTSTTTVALAQLPFVEHIVALEYEPFLRGFAEPFYEQAGVSHKIDFRLGDAHQTLQNLENECQSFDMVFLDADKGGYWKYYDTLMSSNTLLAPDAVIIADNTLYKSSVYAPHALFKEGGEELRLFNQKVLDDPRSTVVVLPVRDGISLIRRASPVA